MEPWEPANVILIGRTPKKVSAHIVQSSLYENKVDLFTGWITRRDASNNKIIP